VFTDAKSFFQTGKVVSTETFDEFPIDTIIGVGSVTLDEITYTSAKSSTPWGALSILPPVSPPNALTQTDVQPATLTFAGGGQTDAIGFYLINSAALGTSVPYGIDVVTASGETLSLTVSVGETSRNIFRGFESPEGIKSITITTPTFANFALDNVSRGVITPEPSSLTLGATGILVLLAFTWWQRTRWMTS